MPPEALAPAICHALLINQLELERMDFEDVQYQLAYIEGKNLAEWANAEEDNKKHGKS